ncbi:zinc finger CW-type PWWP domain protein 1-like isoform X2 [Galleria mellonella]|nr:zinc finger CW-type PWWP domain protein 1-like isoform X2 [Galleria mellonella]
MSSRKKKQKKNFTLRYSEATENTVTRTKSAPKDALSQPAPGLSQREKLLWLQKRRKPGLWVQCDDCDRWRYLAHVIDSHELPKKWFCRMNPDPTMVSCSAPEIPIPLKDEEDLIYSEYSAGSVVWARLQGWPWWPAMVDDCPDTERFYWLDGFSDIPTHYNVVFFDAIEVTRAWIKCNQLKPFSANKKNFNYLFKDKRYKQRLEVAVKQADDANMLPLKHRLSKYCFITRYTGTIINPKKIKKKTLQKFKNQLKRKLNIDFSSDSTSDTDNSSELEMTVSKDASVNKSNIILLGTPKKTKEAANSKANSNKIVTRKEILADNNLSEDNVTSTSVMKTKYEDIPPDSMTVQISSSEIDNSSVDGVHMTSIDKDTPGSPRPSNQNVIHVSSPNSDDFDF